jgi:Ca2+-binding EF-hand superfamily protein
MPGLSATLQDKNIFRVFETLDANHDKKINHEDFNLFAKNICKRVGISIDSNEGKKLAATYQDWWGRLKVDLDTDNDGSITQTEFADGFKRAGVQQYTSDYSNRVAEIIANLVDTDNDGYVSQSDYVKFVTGFPDFDRATASTGFQALDKDGDGRVSVAELKAGWHQMLNSTDPSAPGTALLGNR